MNLPHSDKWFNCRETNHKGECTNIFLLIYFKDHSLTQTNSLVEEEFNNIFTLFRKMLPLKATIEYSFIEESSDDSIRFTEQVIAQYAQPISSKNFE